MVTAARVLAIRTLERGISQSQSISLTASPDIFTRLLLRSVARRFRTYGNAKICGPHPLALSIICLLHIFFLECMHTIHSTFCVSETEISGRKSSVFPLQLSVRCIKVADSLAAARYSAYYRSPSPVPVSEASTAAIQIISHASNLKQLRGRLSSFEPLLTTPPAILLLRQFQRLSPFQLILTDVKLHQIWMPCSAEAKHRGIQCVSPIWTATQELCEHSRVRIPCRRLHLNPGDIRWREIPFRHATYTQHEAARLSLCPSIRINASALIMSWHSNLSGIHLFTSRNAPKVYPVKSWLLQPT